MSTTAPSATPNHGPLPQELWNVVISGLENNDLKNVRLVSLAFRDFASPYLFKTAYFSVIPENIGNIMAWSRDEELRKYVRVLRLDTAAYTPRISSDAEYASWMSRAFESLYDLPPQLSGPLHGQNLLKVLRHDLSWPLGRSYLSGKARRDFVLGFAQCVARENFYQEMVRSDGIYKSLVKLFARFSGVKHVESISKWTSSVNARELFKQYLSRLPKKTQDLITGFNDSGAVQTTEDIVKLVGGVRLGPGLGARVLGPLTATPAPALLPSQYIVHDIVEATLRAIVAKEVKLDSFCVPGPDTMLETRRLKKRYGSMTMSPLVAVRLSRDAPTKNPILAVFKHLRRLELAIDYYHSGTANHAGYSVDTRRLAKAIQAMKSVEHLVLGFQVDTIASVEHRTYSSCSHGPMSLYELMLAQESDWEVTEETDISDESTPETPDADDFMETLAYMIGGSLLQQAADHTNGQANASHPATSSAAPIGAMPFPLIPDSQEMSCCSDKKPPKSVSFAIVPNPWPKLRHLELFNMPAEQEHISRLVRTIPDLTTLKMDNVYHKASPSSTATRRGQAPNAAASQAGFFSVDPSGSNHPLMPMFGPFMVSNAPTGLPGAVPPTTSNPAPPQQHSNGGDSASVSNSRPSSNWVNTIEVISDNLLNLKNCEMSFSIPDREDVRKAICDSVEGAEGIALGIAAARYLTEGHGMGFTMFVANLVIERREMRDRLKSYNAALAAAKLEVKNSKWITKLRDIEDTALRHKEKRDRLLPEIPASAAMDAKLVALDDIIGELAADIKALKVEGQQSGVKQSELGLEEQEAVVERIERAQHDARLALEWLEDEDMNAELVEEDEWEDIVGTNDEDDGMVEDDDDSDDGSDLPDLID